MKTADLLTNLSGQTFSDHTSMIEWLEKQCKQLELDAFKAGMEIAAEKCMNTRVAHKFEHDVLYNQACKTCSEAILTSSQQLTEVPKV